MVSSSYAPEFHNIRISIGTTLKENVILTIFIHKNCFLADVYGFYISSTL